jgi:hypothetical protein
MQVPSGATVPVPRGPVSAKLMFFQPPADGSAPYNYVEKQPEGVPQRNFGDEVHEVVINDARGHEHEISLDRHAFAMLSNVPGSTNPRTDFFDEDQIRREYYPEVEELIKRELPGAHKVVIFDHTIRRASPGANRAPVTRVHIDQTPESAMARVPLHVEDPEEAARLQQGRVRLVNVWRPLTAGPVVSHPLAVADGSSVPDEQLLGVQHRYPHRTGETAAVRYGSQQRWWYWSGMTADERLLLKCFDSDPELGRFGRVPHTAFVDHRTPENAPARESIEVRCLVFG